VTDRVVTGVPDRSLGDSVGTQALVRGLAWVLLGAAVMWARASRGAWSVAALVGGVACTVGGDSSGTLSGGASASAADTAGTDGPSTDDGDDGTGEPSGGDASGDASASLGTSEASTGADDEGSSSGSDSAGTTEDGDASSDGSSSDEGGDLADGILDVTIVAHDDCTITTMPASITVPEGTEFTVNWISAATSEAPVDVAKIDQFNAVPIILGMEPGTSYHDEVREWCGELFTGTFDFEITSCFEPHYIPVDCGG